MSFSWTVQQEELSTSAIRGKQLLGFTIFHYRSTRYVHSLFAEDVRDLLVGIGLIVILTGYDLFDGCLYGQRRIEEDIERDYFLVRKLDELVRSEERRVGKECRL